MNYDVVIIGAGFSGLTLAHHLPRNLKILILDKKEALNSCIESTGLITEATKNLLQDFFPVERFLPNKITTIGVISTDFETSFFSQIDHPWIYSTDTPNLIKALSEALPKNVELKIKAGFSGCRLVENDVYPVKITYQENNQTKMVFAKFIVGADGSHSAVAKNGKDLSKNRKFLIGYEKVFYGNILLGAEPGNTVYHFWFGEFSLGYGGWLSPTIINDKKAFRLGLAKLKENGAGLSKINEFIKILQRKKIIEIEPKTKEIYSFGSQIPIGGPLKKVYNKHCLLIGDSAGFCGAFAADGIKGAIVSAKAAAKLIPQYLNGDAKAFKRYHQEIQKNNRLMTYYKKQLFYRFIWNRMKSNHTFRAMFDLIARDKEDFLHQFCDSKDRHKSLFGIILKIKNIPLIIKYGFFLLRDLFIK